MGQYNGNVAVYDVKSRNPEPVITSDGSAGKHLDPVWKMKWMDTGAVATTLVSVSTDGRVTRWKISKGLEFNDLMKLKRTVRRDAVYTSQKMSNMARNLKHEAFISRLAAGTSFDFLQHDDRIYLAGMASSFTDGCTILMLVKFCGTCTLRGVCQLVKRVQALRMAGSIGARRLTANST